MKTKIKLPTLKGSYLKVLGFILLALPILATIAITFIVQLIPDEYEKYTVWIFIGIAVIVLLVIFVKKLLKLFVKKNKAAIVTVKSAPAAAKSNKQAGPRWTTVLWVALVVFLIYFFKGYFVELGHKHAIEVVYNNQMLPSLSAQPSIPKEVAWPDGIQRVPLQLGDAQLVPRVWYTFNRDETSLVYIKALESSSATLTTQKLGHQEIYLKQRFNEFGSCKTFEDRTDGSPGKWYTTTDQPVRVRITGIISKRHNS